MDFLTLSRASFSYGDTVVFNDIDLAISQGGVFCLLGPNGCGKTTFIDTLLGIHTLTSGEILLNGKSTTTLSPRQIAHFLAYVPQTYTRDFSFSVMDVLLMGRAPYTSFFDAPDAADRDRAAQTLDSFGLSHLKDRDYTRLSGGETQLVMIMRALVQDTPVIVMDEPTAHLDFNHELLVLETIARLVGHQKKTVVMATHFPNHAFYFENKGIKVDVAFMHKKTIIPAGPPSRALTDPNLEKYYNIKACVVSHTLPGAAPIKQVVPIHTLDSDVS